MAYFDPGQYRAVIKDVCLASSKEKKTPYVQIIVIPKAMVNMSDQSEMEIPNDYEREVKLWLTDATAERTCEDLRRIGFVGNAFDDIDSGPHHDALVGKEIQVRCEHEEYEGKTFEKFYLSTSGGMIARAPLDNNGVRKLNALFGKVLKSKPAVQASDPVAEQFEQETHQKIKPLTEAEGKGEVEDDEPTVPADDDIPF